MTARAIGILSEHPEWTNKRIAESIGTNAKYLASLDRYRAARRAIAESGKRDLPRGHRTKGKLEAENERIER